MSSRPRSLVLATLLVASAARASPPGPPAAAPPPEAGASRGPEVVKLRFGWPAPSEAQVTYRRTRSRSGERPTAFVARYASRVERAPEGLVVRTGATRWEGDLPFPPALAKGAIRASEQVAQRIRPDGAFDGLEGAEEMRPVLARLLADAKLPPEQVDRALSLGLAAMRAESEELWNLAVGFWIGADLELAAPYVMQGEAELPLVPGVRAASGIEFQVRRRVPCAAAERVPRCVEVTLRQTPEHAAVERARAAIAARLAGPDAPLDAPLGDLDLESELLLVTDPATLLPHRLVWTKSLRAGGGERGAPALELVDRSEYDYRYDAPAKPAPPARRPKRPAAPPARAASAPSAQR